VVNTPYGPGLWYGLSNAALALELKGSTPMEGRKLVNQFPFKLFPLKKFGLSGLLACFLLAFQLSHRDSK